jgi:hypothetical protein
LASFADNYGNYPDNQAHAARANRRLVQDGEKAREILLN